MDQNKITLKNFGRYHFDTAGNAYNTALDTKMGVQQHSGIEYFRLTNDEGRRLSLSHEHIKELIAVEHKPAEPVAVVVADDAPVKSNFIPFFRWMNKPAQLSRILRLLPDNIDNYVELNCGNGALLFNVMPQVRGNIFISDEVAIVNNVYEMVRMMPFGVIDGLKWLHKKYGTDQEAYYTVRRIFNSSPHSIEQAVRFIYLNHLCYSGFYRFNGKSEFNVPYSKATRFTGFPYEAIGAAAAMLKRVRVSSYVDPMKLDKSFLVVRQLPHATFQKFAKIDFGEEAQNKIVEEFNNFTKRGIKCLMHGPVNEAFGSKIKGTPVYYYSDPNEMIITNYAN